MSPYKFTSLAQLQKTAQTIVYIPSPNERKLELENESLRQRLELVEEQNKRFLELLARCSEVPFNDVVAAINGDSMENF